MRLRRHNYDLLPRSQDMDLMVSAVNIPLPPQLRAHLKTWTREDMSVRVFQGVRRGGPPAHRVWCRETFEMETGKLLAREYFNPNQGSVVRLPTPALPDCSPLRADRRSIRSVFWYSETDVLPAHLTRCLPVLLRRDAAPRDGFPPLVPTRGEDEQPPVDDGLPPERRDTGSLHEELRSEEWVQVMDQPQCES